MNQKDEVKLVKLKQEAKAELPSDENFPFIIASNTFHIKVVAITYNYILIAVLMIITLILITLSRG